MKKNNETNSSSIDYFETISSIQEIKELLIKEISKEFNLFFLRPPLVTQTQIGVNDNFRMNSRTIDFDAHKSGQIYEILQSHNKWRRMELYKLKFSKNQGLITEGFIIRRDEPYNGLENFIYEDLGFDFVVDNDLKEIEEKISQCTNFLINLFLRTIKYFSVKYKNIFDKKYAKPENLTIRQIKYKYPLMTTEESIRKELISKNILILSGLEKEISNGKIFKSESQDLYNWVNYEKVYFFNFLKEKGVELFKVGLSVDKKSLALQNTITKENRKMDTDYSHLITKEKLPSTISCSINLSELMMIILDKRHISEVLASCWDEKTTAHIKKNNINAL